MKVLPRLINEESKGRNLARLISLFVLFSDNSHNSGHVVVGTIVTFLPLSESKVGHFRVFSVDCISPRGF